MPSATTSTAATALTMLDQLTAVWNVELFTEPDAYTVRYLAYVEAVRIRVEDDTDVRQARCLLRRDQPFAHGLQS